MRDTVRDVFFGIVTPTSTAVPDTGAALPEGSTLESVMAGRSWREALAGMYYVKPNYVGRSSHLCNAGFVVLPASRGIKLGLALGRSFLHFAPLLSKRFFSFKTRACVSDKLSCPTTEYRGSVFNLVYASNGASAAIWDRLGFTRTGVIPGGGRLKVGDNGSGLQACPLFESGTLADFMLAI